MSNIQPTCFAHLLPGVVAYFTLKSIQKRMRKISINERPIMALVLADPTTGNELILRSELYQEMIERGIEANLLPPEELI